MGEIVGIVLAGGLGTRFEDGNKLLATVDGEPVVRHAARTLAVPAVEYTIAVLGHDARTVGQAVSADVEETVSNPDFAEGQSASVRAGTRAARERDADAAIFLPGDMPRVDPETVTRVVETYRSDGGEVVVPSFDGKRGNPVLFDGTCFAELLELSGDTGGRALFDAADVRRVAVDDPGIHRDVDTVADRARLDRLESDGTDPDPR
ncbi:nucleotidyltransferase family protein [Natrarchaeobius halalkaliphilus]|uniref:Nucleotidyltransferase family protein n=1 Tax=Natrarchaeobius halalkaliphilus TaxID=1679091 RepID=A0A3N6MC84_9EURY|nr:nucleotidyltransferase family protein [Natrarchaeobius halalkaliphilus]RQG93101.1 nucleotidyltransferase family protein [Natrarchaeobius halalkaliphilus]